MLRLKRSVLPLLVISLTACSVPRPAGMACVVDLPDNQNICFDLQKDFDDQGNIKPDAKPQLLPLDMDKRVNFDPDTWANVKAYIRKLKDRAQCSN